MRLFLAVFFDPTRVNTYRHCTGIVTIIIIIIIITFAMKARGRRTGHVIRAASFFFEPKKRLDVCQFHHFHFRSLQHSHVTRAMHLTLLLKFLSGFLFNGSFATNGHMLQNTLCWRASCAQGHPKQSDFIQSHWMDVSVGRLLSSIVDFVPCDPLAAKVPLSVENIISIGCAFAQLAKRCGLVLDLMLHCQPMGPLQLAVTWYKIRHAGEQAIHWDVQNKATSSRKICIFVVLDVPVRSLLSSMADFVPCDRQLQRAH